jgi:hypothetical protein
MARKWGRSNAGGDSDESKGGTPKRRDAKPVIDWKAKLAIQALVTAADGVVTLPKSGEGDTRGSGYARGLLGKTPEKPKLKVIALRRDENDTTVTVGIATRNGQIANEITVGGVLTEHNALATGTEIAKLLKDPGSAAMCGRKLLELTGQPVGTKVAFTLGAGNRLAIESGKE